MATPKQAVSKMFIHTASKVLAAMRAARKHFVGLRNPQTGDVAFLGAGEITSYPSLYDDAISRGEIPVGFCALRPTAASAAGRVAYYAWDVDTFSGYDRAELTRRVMADCMPKCEGFEESCDRPAPAHVTTAIRIGIGAEKHWFCVEHAARINEYLDSVCWMPGCRKQAVDYAESPIHGKFPLCAEHAREFQAVQDAHDSTNRP
jgi:hypothetical protein